MNLLGCLALLNSVSFVAAQCTLAFPWLTSDECGVDPLDNSYPEYPVSFIGSCQGPGETLIASGFLTGTDGAGTLVYANPILLRALTLLMVLPTLQYKQDRE